MLSKKNLTAKTMIIKNLKIQMLAGNSLKICVGAGFEISSTLEAVTTTSCQPTKNVCLLLDKTKKK